MNVVKWGLWKELYIYMSQNCYLIEKAKNSHHLVVMRVPVVVSIKSEMVLRIADAYVLLHLS